MHRHCMAVYMHCIYCKECIIYAGNICILLFSLIDIFVIMVCGGAVPRVDHRDDASCGVFLFIFFFLLLLVIKNTIPNPPPPSPFLDQKG